MKSNSYFEQFNATLKIFNMGLGYVVNRDTSETFYVKRNNLNGALSGDKVKISVIQTHLLKYPIAKVKKVVKRGSSKLFAKLYKSKNLILASIYPLQSKKIIIKNSEKNISDGDIYQIKIIDWRENNQAAYAEIVELKFKSNHPDSDYFYCASKYGINNLSIDNIVSQKFDKYKDILKNNIKNRMDLSHLQTFTIDPKNAKDFDDAISIKKINNQIELYIHIADVSIFIEENDSIDILAKERGNSFYFDEKTTHMIPEVLSVDICSFIPNKKRIAFTIKVMLNKNMDIIDYDFLESFIISKRRFSYCEVEKIIKGIKKDDYKTNLKLLKYLADELKAKRLKDDGFELSDNEEKNIFSNEKDNGAQIRSFKSTMVIEECMLLANKQAAKKLSNIADTSNEFGLFRNHEFPSMRSETYIKELMHLENKTTYNELGNIKAKHINNFLNSIEKDKRSIMSALIIRKMKKANYSTMNLGHYGLGMNGYTHFTSPIRRYADLIVHRIIKGTFENKKSIFEIIQNCNEGEIKSQSIKREYDTIKGLKLLINKKDQILNGYIIKIKRSRIIVTEILTGVDGIILNNKLPFGKYEFDDNMLTMRNRFDSTRFEVGQKISIKVETINLITQEMFFILAN